MESDVKYKVRPKFNLIYELVMPLGGKFRRSLGIILVLIITIIAMKVAGSKINMDAIVLGISAMDVLFWIAIFFIIIFALKFFIDLILKIMQYNRISYTFYSDNLTYEDTFLNQQRKVIKYENIKEVEVRRTIIDRIMGFGIIIISTNAEGNFNSGLIIYGIENPDEVYKIINDLLYSSKNKQENKNNDYLVDIKSDEKVTEKIKVSDVSEQSQDEFKNSLKNIK